MIVMTDRIDLLTEILNDVTAREDERDDAAMDLGDYDDGRALSALLEFISNPKNDEMILDSCYDSIAQILTRRTAFDLNLYQKLDPPTQKSIKTYIKNVKPEWLHLLQG